MKPRVLVVDDDPAMCAMLEEALGEAGFEVVVERDAPTAAERARDADLDALVTDINMPRLDGIALCRRVVDHRDDLPVVIVTGFGSMEAAIGALRAGAFDFVTKPLDPDALALTLRRAVEVGALRREVRRLRREAAAAGRFGELVGDSAPMRELFTVLDQVADQDVTVLVQGETGTGKELVARALHLRGPRAARPFVAVNCSALPEALAESELFGHVRGAFTDARGPRRGLLFEADGGTLFLDEIGELSVAMQPKLLRALQERRARPVGADREQAFDVRVVAATNRDLLQEVDAGRFRADLYYRLAVVTAEVPPLRRRGNDVLLLAQGFLGSAARRMGRPATGFSPAAAERLLAWRWPGNVRELQNVVERAVLLSRGDRVELQDLPEALREAAPGPTGEEDLTLDGVERRHIQRVLDLAGGSKSRAARLLGIDRATLYRKLERGG